MSDEITFSYYEYPSHINGIFGFEYDFTKKYLENPDNVKKT